MSSYIAQPLDASNPVVVTSAMQSALTEIATAITDRTTDPGVANAGFDSWWNNGGVVTISTGYSPSLDFSNPLNSMYIPLIFQDF